jgi:uncharacterized protein YybS (DUF2232 family)
MAEGAIFAAITAMLALIGVYIPLINIVTFLVVAVPIIIVIVRNSLSTGVISSIVATFLVGILAGPITALFFYLQFMLLALAYGYLFKYKYSAGKILAVGTFVATIATILIMAISMLVGGIDLVQQKEMLYETVDRTIKIYEDYGMMEQFTERGIDKVQLRQMLTDMVNFFIRVFPALLIVGSIFTALTHFIMAQIALRRFGHDIPHFPPFYEWHLPWYTIWGLIGGWGSFLLGDIYQQDILKTLGQNIMIMYGVILFILGLSVVTYYFKKYQLPRITRIIIIMTAFFLFSGFVMATIFIGMFDLILDHRQLNRNPKET